MTKITLLADHRADATPAASLYRRFGHDVSVTAQDLPLEEYTAGLEALRAADVFVLLLPAGLGPHVAAAYYAGEGYPVILVGVPDEPQSVQWATAITASPLGVLLYLREQADARANTPPPAPVTPRPGMDWRHGVFEPFPQAGPMVTNPGRDVPIRLMKYGRVYRWEAFELNTKNTPPPAGADDPPKIVVSTPALPPASARSRESELCPPRPIPRRSCS